MEKVLRKPNLPESGVLLERDMKDRAEITSREAVRIRHVIIGIPPVCQNYRTQSGCKFGDKCVETNEEAETEWWKRFCCFVEELEATLRCV